ncbi:hypothetical protein GGI26_005640 [Coemansia sp. RSA 1358]|uniref:Uncharacterized protein n=1 Tax=Coemansia umbellata TaxID=1424467 RepID=A0ABQ8PFU2_9FUNG|nr:hypothetical protein EDC05_005328 [Coemansia umbellata]KAJ2619688.1 hypothetical protein GGI26_005640 [Coemansia sp. RSA 1358]
MLTPIKDIKFPGDDAFCVIASLTLDDTHKARLIELSKKVPKHIPRPPIGDSVDIRALKPIGPD